MSSPATNSQAERAIISSTRCKPCSVAACWLQRIILPSIVVTVIASGEVSTMLR